MTFVQLIMAGIFFGIAYFLLQVFTDFGSQSTTVYFGGLAIVAGVIVVTVRKMFPG